MNDFIAGATALGFGVIATFFLRFWRQTADRLFAVFAAAFGLMAVGRLVSSLVHVDADHTHFLYLFRLTAHVLILFAIIDKNRARGATPTASAGARR